MENPCESESSLQKAESGYAEASISPSVRPKWDWFDNTIITEYQTCPKKAYLKYQKHFRPKRVSEILEFGRAYHKAKELALLGRPAAEIDAAITSFVPPPDEDLRTQAKLNKAVRTWQAERYPPKWDKTISVEEAIDVKIGKYNFVVKPDLVIEWRGGIYGYESKHTAKLTHNYFDGFKRNSQIDAQMLAIKSKFGSCLGIYVEATIIRKGGPTSKLKEIEFITDIISKGPEELGCAEKYFEKWMDVISNDTEFLENRKGCFAYGRPCEFLGLCTGRVDNPEEHFKIEVWNPKTKEEASGE